MSLLGQRGRLGNQLWQIASSVGVAKLMGQRLVLPRWRYQPYFNVPPTLFADRPKGKEAHTMPALDHIAERHRSYMQDLTLWVNVEDEIREWFQPSVAALELLQVQVPVFFDVPAEDRIALHYRRGDAVTAGARLYPLQSPLYAREALEQLGPGEVFIFSDDPKWCIENLGWIEDQHLVDGNNDWQDLLLMSLCTRHAIANSSFSYWGAQIAGDQTARYPSRWYGKDFRDLSHHNMIPQGWVGVHDPKAGARR